MKTSWTYITPMTQVMYLDVYWRLVELVLLVTVLWRVGEPRNVKNNSLRTEVRKLRGLLKIFTESAVAEQQIVLREAERLEDERKQQEFAKKLELLSLNPDRPIGGAVKAYYDELEQQYKETLNMEAPIDK